MLWDATEQISPILVAPNPLEILPIPAQFILAQYFGKVDAICWVFGIVNVEAIPRHMLRVEYASLNGIVPHGCPGQGG